VNLSSEVILGIISALGAILTGAVGKMWLWFTGELMECKEDRKALHLRTEDLHEKITEISTAVGRLEGKLSRDSPAEV
jgi:hypothetical protein